VRIDSPLDETPHAWRLNLIAALRRLCIFKLRLKVLGATIKGRTSRSSADEKGCFLSVAVRKTDLKGDGNTTEANGFMPEMDWGVR
jgi:hypothetical protein